MVALDKTLPIPLYHQLKNVLMAGIESGRLAEEEQLPTESELAGRFGVSKITVRQALRELSDLGYIRREQGRGTFVSRRKLVQGPGELLSFTEEMRRHRLADGEPMAIQTAYIAAELVPGLLGENLESLSIYETLQTRYGLRPARARETHFAVSVDPDVAALLQVQPGSPALATERVTYLASGRPLEYVNSVIRGDRYRIVLDLVKDPHGG
jgi:GntR family transcriptional regulator